jgi:hypothetical protein
MPDRAPETVAAAHRVFSQSIDDEKQILTGMAS